MPFPFCKECFEVIEPFIPEAFVIGQPSPRALHGNGVGPHVLKAAVFFSGDEIGVFENLQMLGDGGQRHSIRPRNLAYRFRFAGDSPQDGAPGGIGERVEDPIQLQRSSLIERLNHMVEWMLRSGPERVNRLVECAVV